MTSPAPTDSDRTDQPPFEPWRAIEADLLCVEGVERDTLAGEPHFRVVVDDDANEYTFTATEFAQQIARDAGLPDVLVETEEETRHFLGVTSGGLKVGIRLTGRFLGPHRNPIPFSALASDMRASVFSGVFEGLLVNDTSPLLWPVSAEVYRAYNDDDLFADDDEDDTDATVDGPWDEDGNP